MTPHHLFSRSRLYLAHTGLRTIAPWRGTLNTCQANGATKEVADKLKALDVEKLLEKEKPRQAIPGVPAPVAPARGYAAHAGFAAPEALAAALFHNHNMAPWYDMMAAGANRRRRGRGRAAQHARAHAMAQGYMQQGFPPW